MSEKHSQPKVLYEDNHLLALEKPVGWLVQGDKTGDETLSDWGRRYIKDKYKKPGDAFLHPVHRIDRPVSGITLFARTSKALSRLTTAFRENEIHKTYVCLVDGKPKDYRGKLKDWLIKDSRNNQSRVVGKSARGAKESELDYELIAFDGKFSLLRIRPRTGRPHQIRVQLSNMGHTIKGDIKYGFPAANRNKGISLHAFKLELIHPVKKEKLTITSKPNWQILNKEIDELD